MYSLILSPHLDDALYSMSSFLCNHYGDVIIATLFTREVENDYQGHYALYADMKTRKKEDVSAIKKIEEMNMHIRIKMIYLDLPDQIFRSKCSHIEEPIYDAFHNLHDTYEISAIYCPLGIGKHYDHILTHNICKEVFHANKTFFYYDYPYCTLNLNVQTRLNQLGLKQSDTIHCSDMYNHYICPIYSSTPIIFRIFNILWDSLTGCFQFCNDDDKTKFTTYSYYAMPEDKYKIISRYSSQVKPIFKDTTNLKHILRTYNKECYIKIHS